MSTLNNYTQLGPRQGSSYRQFFVNGTRIRAETLYHETVGTGARTPEQVAEDFGVPLEAVLESIRYCNENENLLRQERDEDLADIRARGLDQPPLVPTDQDR